MTERSQVKRRMKAQRKQAEEAVARFDAQYSTEVIPGGAFAATLSQLRDAHALSRLGKNRRVHTRET